MFTFSHELGMVIYSSDTSGYYIGMLALLSPVMYMDMITDGCLKGLGQMLWSMGINVFDSLLCIAVVIVLLPRYGLTGYLVVIFISELINFVLSITKLGSMVRLDIKTGKILLSFLCAVGACQFSRLGLNLLGIRYPTAAVLAAAIAAAGAMYIILLGICIRKKTTT